jgi:hypothetical protein
MPAWLIAEIEVLARSGPALPLALMFGVALLQALILPRRLWAKGGWVAAVALCGIGAATLLRWEQRAATIAEADQAAVEIAALRGLWDQWDGLSRSLPAAQDEAPAASFDSIDDALASLSAKRAAIEAQIEALKLGKRDRSIDAETAVKLAEYLRQFGVYRAVVSCAAGDREAYTYANQLANILRAAGWDANGPEATVSEGGSAMAVALFMRNPSAPEAAKILIDAFSRFNIPIQSAIGASDAIPDAATVELFVAKKPPEGVVR